VLDGRVVVIRVVDAEADLRRDGQRDAGPAIGGDRVEAKAGQREVEVPMLGVVDEGVGHSNISYLGPGASGIMGEQELAPAVPARHLVVRRLNLQRSGTVVVNQVGVAELPAGARIHHREGAGGNDRLQIGPMLGSR